MVENHEFSPAERYEQTKTANFIASSKLDGVDCGVSSKNFVGALSEALISVGIHAPAWPGYPDRSMIPADWKPIPNLKVVSEESLSLTKAELEIILSAMEFTQYHDSLDERESSLYYKIYRFVTA